MDSKTFGIGILTLTAVMLLLGNYFVSPSVMGQEAIRDRDYSLVTARLRGGGDGLYVLDNRTGQVAVFSYDVGARALRPRAVMPMEEALFLEEW